MTDKISLSDGKDGCTEMTAPPSYYAAGVSPDYFVDPPPTQPNNYFTDPNAYQAQSYPTSNSPASPTPVPDATLPKGWTTYQDPASGKQYYLNNTTGITQWDRPVVPYEVTPAPDAVVLTIEQSKATVAETKAQMKQLCSPITAGSSESAVEYFGPSGLLAKGLDPNVINSTTLENASIIQESPEITSNCCRLLCIQCPFLVLNALFIACLVVIIVLGVMDIQVSTGLNIAFPLILPTAFFGFLYLMFVCAPMICCNRNQQITTTDQTSLIIQQEPQKWSTCTHLRTFLCIKKGSKTIDEVVEYFSYSRQQQPTLQIHINAFHYESRGSGKNRRRVAVTTFSTHIPFPIIGWRDVSNTPASLKECLESIPKSHLAINWHHGFIIDSSQCDIIYQAKRTAWEQYHLRDTHCTVTVEYGLQSKNGTIEYHTTDIINNDSNGCSQCITSTFLNRYSFFFLTFFAMYFVPAFLFSCLYKSVEFHDIKRIHINYPSVLLPSAQLPPSTVQPQTVADFLAPGPSAAASGPFPSPPPPQISPPPQQQPGPYAQPPSSGPNSDFPPMAQ